MTCRTELLTLLKKWVDPTIFIIGRLYILVELDLETAHLTFYCCTCLSCHAILLMIDINKNF